MRFSNYYNHEGRNRNIYSRNNLLGMTMKELLERELELAYQYNTIGIPADEELMNSEFAHQYQDENGFSHWQAGEKMPDNLVQQAEVQPQTTNQSKPVTNPQSTMQEMDKENLSTQNLLQQPLNTISESISPKNAQLQGFESGTNGFAQQKKSMESPNSGTFAPNDEKYFMVDFQSDLNKIMQQKEKSPEEQAKQNLQKYVPLEDTGYTDEPYLTYEDLLGDETEEEKLAREQKEIETFDKLFEEELNKNDKTQNTEPYLTYEELLGLEPQSENAKEVPPTEEMLRKQMEENGVPTGGASGIDNAPTFALGIEKTNKDNMTLKEKIIDKLIKNPLMLDDYPISANFYVDAVDNFSRAKQNPNAHIINNQEELDAETKAALKNYGIKPSERGIIYDENSYVSRRFAKSSALKNIFKENYKNIENGTFQAQDINFDANMKDAMFNKQKFDNYSSVQHAKLIDAYIDEKGHKHGRFIDNYDFERRNAEKLADKIKASINNHGYDMQEKGNLENYYTIIDFVLEESIKEKLKRLFHKY